MSPLKPGSGAVTLSTKVAKAPISPNEPGSVNSAMCSRAVRRPAAWIAPTASGPPMWVVTCSRSSRSRSTVLISSDISSAPVPSVSGRVMCSPEGLS